MRVEVSLKEEFENLNSELGMEARAILKSIQTEDVKLSHAKNLTRSDRHYFRARYNYYKLCLLRLRSEERRAIEPVLSSFHQKIGELERVDDASREVTPFLHSVGKEDVKVMKEHPKTNLNLTRENREDIVSQLSLLQLALSAELTAASKKVLSDNVTRVVKQLKDLSP